MASVGGSGFERPVATCSHAWLGFGFGFVMIAFRSWLVIVPCSMPAFSESSEQLDSSANFPKESFFAQLTKLAYRFDEGHVCNVRLPHRL